MKNYSATRITARILRPAFLFFLAAVLFLACVSPATAQQKDKKKKKDNTPAADNSNTIIPLADDRQIDYMLSEVLGAWQLGDIEKLHKDYAEDVSMVNGGWAPPIIGWTNYAAIYQQQRARMQQVRMERSNTYIKVSGSVAWACYQWDFEGVVDGQSTASRGQTTVVLEKRNNRWVIVHNHTSLVQNLPPPAPASTPATPQQPPAKPAAR